MDESDPMRDAIHQVIQEQGPDLKKSAVLVGWALVCDWMDEDGERWLSKAHASMIPTWYANGMHSEAIRGTWPTDDDD